MILRVLGLRRSFGGVRAVDGLDLTVRTGEIYGFLGRNGAGKTTTIRMLMGILKPDGGAIELIGQTSRRTTLRQKQSIGYVSQEQTFYPWMSCRALGKFVSGFYPNWDMQEFDRLLRIFELPPARKTSHLSGGMKVKLALALALAHRPALLILDEPTSGLDPVARREFLDIIHHQARQYGRTTFFSSHRIDEVERVAERIGILDRGKLRYEGNIATLQRRVRLLRANGAVSGETHEPAANQPPDFLKLPSGGSVIKDLSEPESRAWIVDAPEEAWNEFSHPSFQAETLPLEDIFIAYVGRAPTEL